MNEGNRNKGYLETETDLAKRKRTGLVYFSQAVQSTPSLRTGHTPKSPNTS